MRIGEIHDLEDLRAPELAETGCLHRSLRSRLRDVAPAARTTVCQPRVLGPSASATRGRAVRPALAPRSAADVLSAPSPRPHTSRARPAAPSSALSVQSAASTPDRRSLGTTSSTDRRRSQRSGRDARVCTRPPEATSTRVGPGRRSLRVGCGRLVTRVRKPGRSSIGWRTRWRVGNGEGKPAGLPQRSLVAAAAWSSASGGGRQSRQRNDVVFVSERREEGDLWPPWARRTGSSPFSSAARRSSVDGRRARVTATAITRSVRSVPRRAGCAAQ